MKLTIGMASFNNFIEVWFTIQALRMYQDLTDTEILVIDNYGDPKLAAFAGNWAHSNVRVVVYTGVQGTAPAKQKVFEEALGEWVICMDSHVLLNPGVVKRFRAWADAHPYCSDLLHGPMLYDDCISMADSMRDEWSGGMWGIWNNKAVGDEVDAYSIPMHGMGLAACRKEAWQGFNPAMRGFGGEEGYIHTKFRQAGREIQCLPWMKWLHMFYTAHGDCSAPHVPLLLDVARNYCAGFAELGLPMEPVIAAFGEDLVAEAQESLRTAA